MGKEGVLSLVVLPLSYIVLFVFFVISTREGLYVPLALIAFFLVVVSPSFIIERIGKIVKQKEERGENPFDGGKVVGYAERVLVYLAFLIISAISQSSVVSVFNFLSFIIAGKSIYRFPVIRSERSKLSADWYISGTFFSIGLATFLSSLLIPNTPLFNLLRGQVCQ